VATLNTFAIRIAPVGLEGILRPPRQDRGVVLFAHGSGSGRLSPRNNHVAEALGEAGLGSLLFDLLSESEAADRNNVFDIDLLACRLVLATDWLYEQGGLRGRPVGYFGASTGAAAALVAETLTPHPIGAVVSRGGRPDMAMPVLHKVRAPVLLIVGGDDHPVLQWNEQALEAISGEKEIVIVKGAGHLFEEPGTMDIVIAHARRWFEPRLRLPE
jgi:putative phosphoribosyl transferase